MLLDRYQGCHSAPLIAKRCSGAIIDLHPTGHNTRIGKNSMPRALKNLDISLGLAIIPVQLFTAASSHGVAFHLLHAKCGSRIQMRLECPVHGIVPREETVKGYEVAKDEYVRF